MPNMIKIWPWKTAPKKYKKLSDNGGDEDWVVYVPGEYLAEVENSIWLTATSSTADPQKILLESGDYIFIGSHS